MHACMYFSDIPDGTPCQLFVIACSGWNLEVLLKRPSRTEPTNLTLPPLGCSEKDLQ